MKFKLFFFLYIVKYFNNFYFLIQMPTSVIRMLLNHFCWDKGKLMERLYDGDQEKLFTEAHIVYPFAKASALAPNVECQVSFSYY